MLDYVDKEKKDEKRKKKKELIDSIFLKGKFVAEIATYLTLIGYILAGILWLTKAEILVQFLALMESWIKFYQVIIAGYVIGSGVKRGAEAYVIAQNGHNGNSIEPPPIPSPIPPVNTGETSASA